MNNGVIQLDREQNSLLPFPMEPIMPFQQAALARLFALYQALYVSNKEWAWVHSEGEIQAVVSQWHSSYGYNHEAYFKALEAWYRVDTSADSTQHPLSDYLLFEALCSIAIDMEWYNLHGSLYAYKTLAKWRLYKPAS